MTRRRHLRELLGEEQEPFVLQTFLDEKKRSLLSRRDQGRQCRRPTTGNRACGPSASSVVPESSSPASRTAAAGKRMMMLELKRRRRRRRRRSGREKGEGGVAADVAGVGSVILALLRRLLRRWKAGGRSRRRRRLCVREVLGWDSPAAADVGEMGCGCGEEGGEPEEEVSMMQCSDGADRTHRFMLTPASSDNRRRKLEIEDGALEKPYSCEEEKDQYSPVSVLDPAFAADDRGRDEVGAGAGEQQLEQTRVHVVEVHLLGFQHGFAAAAQRCRNKQPARSFEGLAGLELDGEISWLELVADGGGSSKVPRRLARDLFAEEGAGDEKAGELRRWMEVGRAEGEAADTIDAMVERDLSRETRRWARREEEAREVVEGMELHILWGLVEDVLGDLLVL